MADGKKRDDFTIEMGERNGERYEPSRPAFRPAPAIPLPSIANNPIVPILCYCASSILMTVLNKFVLSGLDFNLNFFLLCVQVRSEPPQTLTRQLMRDNRGSSVFLQFRQ